jgi:hypothetical protein
MLHAILPKFFPGFVRKEQRTLPWGGNWMSVSLSAHYSFANFKGMQKEVRYESEFPTGHGRVRTSVTLSTRAIEYHRIQDCWQSMRVWGTASPLVYVGVSIIQGACIICNLSLITSQGR